MAARAARAAVVRTSTDPALILAANQAYAAAVAGPLATRDAAVEAALAAWITSVDAAFTAYDTATLSPAEAAAKATFRSLDPRRGADLPCRGEGRQGRLQVGDRRCPRAAACVGERRDRRLPGQPEDRRRQGDVRGCVHAARLAFSTDPAVVAAKAAKVTAITSARTAYRTAVTAARDAFFAATGHNPKRWKPVLPRVR